MENNKFLYLDKIVIGSSLEAIMCAFYNKFKILYSRLSRPDEYDIVEDYGLGKSRLETWNKHMFQLSLAGYVPFSDKIKHIRYVDKDIIKVITKEENVFTIKYNEIYVFDDYNFLDLPPSTSKTSEEVRILDWLKVTEGKIDPNTENIFNRNKFMNQIFFDKKSDTDICVISYCKQSKLDTVEEHIVKVKTESLLSTEENPISLDHVRREIFPLGKEVYEDFDNVIFSYTNEKLMYELRLEWRRIDYMKYLRIKLGISNDRDE